MLLIAVEKWVVIVVNNKDTQHKDNLKQLPWSAQRYL